jgi:hypothetical protein
MNFPLPRVIIARGHDESGTPVAKSSFATDHQGLLSPLTPGSP